MTPHPHSVSRLATYVLVLGLTSATTLAHAQAPSYAQAQQALQAGQYATAFQAFQALAREGDAASQFQLSLLYRSGRGVAPNAQQALQWLQRAAQGRNAEALSNLGGEYARGQSVRQDKVKALALFLLAQAQGADVGGSNAQTVARTLSAAQIAQAQAMAQGCHTGPMQPCM